MADLKVQVVMFPARLWRWHFCVIWSDGVVMSSTKPSWGHGRTYARAHLVAQEARRG